MRPFGALVLEMIGMVESTLHGLKTGVWEAPDWEEAKQQAEPSKDELLALWDKTAQALRTGFPQLPETCFHEAHTAFGQWTMPGADLILYLIDNEVHHRAQGFVYLRLLGTPPPAFYER